jgi:hypothetical protein
MRLPVAAVSIAQLFLALANVRSVEKPLNGDHVRDKCRLGMVRGRRTLLRRTQHALDWPLPAHKQWSRACL